MKIEDMDEVQKALAMKGTLEAEDAADKAVADAMATVSAGGENADLAPLKVRGHASAHMSNKQTNKAWKQLVH